MTAREMRETVCAWARRSYEEKLFAGTSGNLSVFDREEGLMAITPSSVPYEGMVPEDIVLLRMDGMAVEGRYRPSSEWRMHAAIYRARPRAGAVVHTHSPYAASFAVNRREIPLALIEMVLFLGGGVPLADFAVPGTWAVGEAAVRAMAGRTACLLASHGAVAVGETLDQAHLRAVYLEDAAKICALALASGGPVVTLTAEEAAAMPRPEDA